MPPAIQPETTGIGIRPGISFCGTHPPQGRLGVPSDAPRCDDGRMQHIRIRTVEVDGHMLRVGTKAGEGPPLLVFNGIGANLELLEPLASELRGVEAIFFEVPGTGDTAPRRSPYRLSTLARLAGSQSIRFGIRLSDLLQPVHSY